MFTTEQIRVLNDARTILKSTMELPNTWQGGRVAETCEHAEDEIFHVLNCADSYGVQKIHTDLIHNQEGDRVRSLGRAESVSVASDEDGFELHITTGDVSYVVNVHGVSEELLATVTKEIGSYWADGRAAAASHQRDLDSRIDDGAYPPGDPKSPGYHDRMSAIYDERER